MKEEIKSNVNIKHAGTGFIIEVKDQFTENNLAITKEELEQIVLYGQLILKSQKESMKIIYVDSRTPDEKERDARITTTTTTASEPAPNEGWKQKMSETFQLVSKQAMRFDEHESVISLSVAKDVARKIISSLLREERARLAEKISGMKRKVPQVEGAWMPIDDRNEARNQALSDVAKILEHEENVGKE